MNFFIKQLLKSKLKGVPDDQIEMFITIVEKNPELFKQIADEIKSKMDAGMTQEAAAMAVMKSHESELKVLMAK